MTNGETYGLMIQRIVRHGTEYLEVVAMRRRGDEDYPINASWYAHEKALYVTDLMIRGWVRDHDKKASFADNRPQFQDAHDIGLLQAKAMVVTLTKVATRIQKDEAREPGDVFMALAIAIDAKWTVIRLGDRMHSSYRDNRWDWMSVGDGRNTYRSLIQKMVSERQTALDEDNKSRAA